ncbi:MAG TPA: crosslink repair DNA glycosylase YcaQ family protein, partial [Thermoanaerobaculia bacterium]|nr:crosslink repair DNA glycosylase YcaQ family protein [Thermoanaerobaculia bacterium]
RSAALAVIDRFGYLQLDTVSVAGARSHAIVLLSRLEGLDPDLPEELLQPGEPLFEYWGHEACWLPLELYPLFGFRRQEFRVHPWWGDLLGEHPGIAEELLRRIEQEGPLRSLDLEGEGSKGWWDLKLTKRVATALWSSGELAVRERRNFQRSFDLTERVIPEALRRAQMPQQEAIERLLLLALSGHGWAQTGTLTATWRLKNRPEEIARALAHLQEQGKVLPCRLDTGGGKTLSGWIRPEDLELAERLASQRPRKDSGVLLSPFDPLLWDRRRVEQLFGFAQVLEIFKRAEHRVFGYYCLPVLAGERLVARYDLKADRKTATLKVLAAHFERDPAPPADRQAAQSALDRYAESLNLELQP